MLETTSVTDATMTETKKAMAGAGSEPRPSRLLPIQALRPDSCRGGDRARDDDPMHKPPFC